MRVCQLRHSPIKGADRIRTYISVCILTLCLTCLTSSQIVALPAFPPAVVHVKIFPCVPVSSRAMSLALVHVPTLRSHVSSVVAPGSQEQMVDVDAWGIVATMQAT